MESSIKAANVAFDELLRSGKAVESERTTFLYGFAAGLCWATEMFNTRRRPRRALPSPQLKLEKQS